VVVPSGLQQQLSLAYCAAALSQQCQQCSCWWWPTLRCVLLRIVAL
jgi:hypothetical protein